MTIVTVEEKEILCDEPSTTPASTASDPLMCLVWMVAHKPGEDASQKPI